MTRPALEPTTVDGLMADVLHGTASAAEVDRLEIMLREQPELRSRYLDQALLHAQLAATPLAAGMSAQPRLIPKEHRHEGILPIGAAPRRQPLPAAVGQLLRGGLVMLAAAAVLTLLVLPPRLSLNRPAGSRSPELNQSAVAAGGYDNRQLPAETVGLLAGLPNGSPQPLLRTTLTAGDAANRLTTTSGAAVEVDAPGLFGLVSGGTGALFRGGARARVSEPEQTYCIESGNLRVVDLGTEFRVNRIGDNQVAVTVLDGEVEVQSRVRLPLVHWSFDDLATGRTATDAIHGLKAVAGAAVTSAAGKVGGAARFDNSREAFLRVEGGTGEKVGTGLLSFSTGLSIEALIVPAWNGTFLDYDEIWRKEDGNSRVLLSFQHDGQKHTVHTVPAVAPGPCLSFGLQLAIPGTKGPRYDELDLPLDGREGRPTLADLTDGQPHHVVASFDSFTGIKAIFIDGRLAFSHTYPEGSLIVSGGPQPGFIGSNQRHENFTGTIDELSLYDFALSAEEVSEHHRRLLAGKPAVPEEALAAKPAARSTTESRHWQAVTRLVAGETRIFNQQLGLPVE